MVPLDGRPGQVSVVLPKAFQHGTCHLQFGAGAVACWAAARWPDIRPLSYEGMAEHDWWRAAPVSPSVHEELQFTCFPCLWSTHCMHQRQELKQWLRRRQQSPVSSICWFAWNDYGVWVGRVLEASPGRRCEWKMWLYKPGASLSDRDRSWAAGVTPTWSN